MEDYIKKALNGDHQAFAQLYDNFAADALRLAAAVTHSPDLAADAVQEAFIRVYKKGYQCKSPDKFKPWFFRIVINESKRIAKKYSIETELDPDCPAAAADNYDLPLAISHALGKLTWEHRSVLVLKFVMGYTENEISVILKKPLGTVKSRIHYAKKALAQKFDGKEEFL